MTTKQPIGYLEDSVLPACKKDLGNQEFLETVRHN